MSADLRAGSWILLCSAAMLATLAAVPTPRDRAATRVETAPPPPPVDGVWWAGTPEPRLVLCMDGSSGTVAVRGEWPKGDATAIAAALGGIRSYSLRAYRVRVRSVGNGDLELTIDDAWAQPVATCKLRANQSGSLLTISECVPQLPWLKAPVDLSRLPDDAQGLVEPFARAMNQLTCLEIYLDRFANPITER